MARASRNNQANNELVASLKPQKTPTAIYVRLSVENSGKSEQKDAIANQIEICKDYVSKQPDLYLYDIYEDNGKTGTVFDRPNFNRLIEDIKIGKIACLIVRDLSRFGRDYIETGTYIERIFPIMGVRFISIKEQFDSLNTNIENESLIIPLQNIINSLYSKDISRKVSSAHKTRMSNKNFKKSTVAYGYKLSEDRRNIIVDEECAKFVLMIFKLKADGVKVADIARKLDFLNAPNPRIRKVQTGVRKTEGKVSNSWSGCTINRILTNQVYIGDTIVGRTKTALYKGVLRQDITNPELWKVFPNTHEPIISKEDFELVQNIILHEKCDRKSKYIKSEINRETLINLFENKIFCADCKNKMYFKKECKNDIWFSVYKCSSYTRKLNATCNSHYITSEELYKKVLESIKIQVKVALDYEKLISSFINSVENKCAKSKLNYYILSTALKANELKKRGQKLYENYAENLLNESEYLKTKLLYDAEYKRLNNEINDAKNKIELNNEFSNENKWFTLMKTISRARELNQAIVDAAIEEISIHSDKSIEVGMKYSDIYSLTMALYRWY